jgi:hypothetical protein
MSATASTYTLFFKACDLLKHRGDVFIIISLSQAPNLDLPREDLDQGLITIWNYSLMLPVVLKAVRQTSLCRIGRDLATVDRLAVPPLRFTGLTLCLLVQIQRVGQVSGWHGEQLVWVDRLHLLLFIHSFSLGRHASYAFRA